VGVKAGGAAHAPPPPGAATAWHALPLPPARPVPPAAAGRAHPLVRAQCRAVPHRHPRVRCNHRLGPQDAARLLKQRRRAGRHAHGWRLNGVERRVAQGAAGAAVARAHRSAQKPSARPGNGPPLPTWEALLQLAAVEQRVRQPVRARRREGALHEGCADVEHPRGREQALRARAARGGERLFCGKPTRTAGPRPRHGALERGCSLAGGRRRGRPCARPRAGAPALALACFVSRSRAL
jgi:hypothetical protein